MPLFADCQKQSVKTGDKGFADYFTRGSRQRTCGKEFIGKETFTTCQVESSRQSLCHLLA